MSERLRVMPADGGQWDAVEALLHQALDLPEHERDAFLEASCGDPALRREVASLISAHERDGRFDRLAERVIAPLLAEAPPVAPPPAAAHRMPALERYRLLDKLGGGGMAVVYRARDERLERDVALKFIAPHLSADEAAKKRFLVEARAAASLEHPNVCTVHEIGETGDGQLYIVMSCYDGETLDRRIARGPLPLEEAVRIARDVARALAKAHERGIVHRDVKPANIMLTADGVVKVLDFGIAKLSAASITQTVGVIGTLAYMSPEQAFGETVDARADVWALGVVLHEMLTAGRPFGGPGQQALLYSILTAELEPVSATRPDVPPAIDGLLRRALAKKPEDRYGSAAELLGALEGVPLPATGPSAPAAQQGIVRTAPDGAGDTTNSILARAGERRRATVLVTGLAGYADLVERLDPASMDRLTTAVRDAAAEIALRHGGIVNEFTGESATLLFGIPTAHEDHYLRAVRAAIDLHARVRAAAAATGAGASDVRLHSGIHVGAVVAQRLRSGDRRFRIAGAPADLAARLASFAEPDAILLSPECHRLVAAFVAAQPAAPLRVAGDAEPIVPLRVTGESEAHTRLEVAERAGLTPYSGRTRELITVEEQVAAAANGSGGFAAVVGEAGAGKSRLLFELRRRAASAGVHIVTGRCDAYDRTTPYVPLVQAIRELLGVGVRDAVADRDVESGVRAIDPSLTEFLPLYCALLAVNGTAHSLPRHLHGEHLHAAMLEAIAALVTAHARTTPTVMLLEDWHWADEGSRAAVEQLADIAPAHSLLLIVTSRPEGATGWTPREGRTIVSLGPLGLDASTAIIRGALRAERVSPTLAQHLHERTGGNPFFLEETCQALLEEGAVVVTDGVAESATSTSELELPETVQAVIRTRLDRLEPDARDTLRMAAVIGRDFAQGVLEEIAGPSLDIAAQMERLRGAGLVQQTALAPEPAWRFKHVLTQEVAYDTLLEHQRVSLHAAAARAIEGRYANRLDEHLDRLAHHFSHAGEWASAIRYAIRAADRSHSLSQFGDALAQLDRTEPWARRLEDERERRASLASILLRQERLCETIGIRARQLQIVEALIELLAPHGGSAHLAEAYLRQGDVYTLLRRFDAADRALGTALRLSRELGDRAAERNALRSLGLLRSHERRAEEAITIFEAALAIDLELGETLAAAGEIASLGNVLRNQGRHAEALEALEQALEYLSEEQDPSKWCSIMVVIASVYRDLGDADTALRYLERTRDVALERRLPIMVSFSMPAIAHIQLERGLTEECLATYRQAADLSRRARHADGLAQALRALSEVLVGLGRHAEAIEPLREAASLFEQLEDPEMQATIRRRLATAHEQMGQAAEARATWEQVLDWSRRSGDLSLEAMALEGVARAARVHGGRDAAIDHYEQALARAITAGDRERELSVRNTLGVIRWEGGSYPEALRHYEAALRICRQLDDRVHEGLVLNSLGATLLRLRRFDEARTALEQAAHVNRETGQRRLEAHSAATLGDVLLAAGRAQAACDSYERARAIREDLGDRAGVGRLLLRLASAHEAGGDAAAAERVRKEALAVADETGDTALRTDAGNAITSGSDHDTPRGSDAALHH